MFAVVFALLAFAGPAQSQPAGDNIDVRVDPRVELMCIIFRVAGNPEYNQPNSKSPYADDLQAHFGKFRDHPVIDTARRLRSQHGVSYDAVMSMAVHLEDAASLKEKVPFDKQPAELDKRWELDDARQFLEQARDFVKKTGFGEFTQAHQKLYTAAAERMSTKLRERAYLPWFDRFFGARPTARFAVLVGMLTGGGNYGVSVRYPDGREEITPVLGVWKFDKDGIPLIDDGIAGTVVHELCHSYTNRLVDEFAERLEPAGKRIFPLVAQAMQEQAYGNWKTMMYESLVRASGVRYALANDGQAAADKAIRGERQRGFEWTGDLSKLLGEYEADRTRYPTLQAFMPKIVDFFNAYQLPAKVVDPNAPKVVSMIPANGAKDVDPNLSEIRVTFDRPMADKSWAVVGGGPDFPELTGKPAYDSECKVLTIPVRLKPGWTYHVWLNRGEFQAFRSKEGVALESVAVTFSTRQN